MLKYQKFTPSGCKEKGLENMNLLQKLNFFSKNKLNFSAKLSLYINLFIAWEPGAA